MPQFHSALPAVLLAVSTLTSVHAQTASISIPAWVEGNTCTSNPKFEATLDGKPVPITAQLGPTSDQMILLVLDLTGDLALIEAAKRALIDEIGKLPPNAWVGLLRDQDGLHVLADPSLERKPLIDAIQGYSSSGQPGLLETVKSSVDLADAMIRKFPVRVSVLYITDGSIYSYRDDYTNPVINESDPHDLSRRFGGTLIEDKISKLMNALGSLQAPVFVVHLNYRRDRLNEIYQNGLVTLTEATGGKASISRSVLEIPVAISGMFARISSAWRLTLEVPGTIRSNIQIRLSAPCPDGNQRMSWRTHFHPKEG